MLEISEGPLKEISNNTLVEQVTFENVKNFNMNFKNKVYDKLHIVDIFF